MTYLEKLNTLKEAFIPLAEQIVRSMDCSSIGNGSARLNFLNDFVLFGPAFEIVESILPLGIVRIAEEVRREISFLEDTPKSYIVGALDPVAAAVTVDIELDKLICPSVFIPAVDESAQLDIFFQACTDIRRISFGRIINFLSTEPAFPSRVFSDPRCQRAIAFAAYAMSRRGISFNAWTKLASFDDPIAILIVLTALIPMTGKSGNPSEDILIVLSNRLSALA